MSTAMGSRSATKTQRSHSTSPKRTFPTVQAASRSLNSFSELTDEEARAFNDREDKVCRQYGKNYHRPQPDGFTLEDLGKRVSQRRRTGEPIAD